MDTHSMTKYCEELCVDIGNRLEKTDDESESRILLTVYQDKCNGIMSALKEDKGAKASDNQTAAILKDIAQLVLDVTYVEEVQLVEDEFPEETAESRMKYVLDSLEHLETSVSKIFPGRNVVECLGSEIMECIRWRKGALLYMFCHTVQSRHSESKFPPHFIKYLEDGIEYLVEMLKTRSDPHWLESSGDASSSSDAQMKTDTLQLIQQGIFSDTHLLALMYCGELCYWYSCACCKEDKKVSRDIGKKKYVSKDQSQADANETDVRNDFESSCPTLTSVQVPVQGIERQCHDETKKLKSKTIPSETDQSLKTTCQSDEAINKHFRIVSVGNSCLKKYLSVTNGPLVGAGWSSSRAEEILQHFTKLKL